MNKRIFFLYLAAIFPAFAFANFYEEGRFTGFYFFEDPEKEIPEEKEMDYSEVTDPEEADRITKENNKKFLQAVNLATLNPTPDHILQALELQGQILDRSLKYSEEVKRLLLSHPNLGALFDTPVNQQGMNVQKAINKAEKREVLAALKEKYFLLLFAERGEPYSEVAVNIAKFMETIHGWEIRIVDTSSEQGSKNSRIIKNFKVKRSPAFFLVNPSSLQNIGKNQASFESYPVGVGALSLPELVENICLQASHHHLTAGREE